MKTPYRHSSRRARGSIAVECAIVVCIFVVIAATMLYIGRILWHYNVIEKAAHDAARFLASATPRETMTSGGGAEPPIVNVAYRIVQAEVAELNPGSGVIIPDALCYNGASWSRCYGVEPVTRVRMRIYAEMADPFFSGLTWPMDVDGPIVLRSVMMTDHVGN